MKLFFFCLYKHDGEKGYKFQLNQRRPNSGKKFKKHDVKAIVDHSLYVFNVNSFEVAKGSKQ